jgi:hypothetical protein
LNDKSANEKGKEYSDDYGLAIFAKKAFTSDSVARIFGCAFQSQTPQNKNY